MTNWKRIYIYPTTVLLALIITLIQTQFAYSEEGYRAIGSLHFAEAWTYFTVGWTWFLPLLILIVEPVYKKRSLRILLFITPLIISVIYYRTVNSYVNRDTDFRLYAGYLYKYPYFLNIVSNIFLAVFFAAGFIEFLEYKKRKKLHA